MGPLRSEGVASRLDVEEHIGQDCMVCPCPGYVGRA